MPVSVGSPTAAANSATQNSATSGAPGPATGTGVSPNRTASPIDSAGCRSAQAHAHRSRSASAASAAARRSRRLLEHRGSGVELRVAAVLVMAPF